MDKNSIRDSVVDWNIRFPIDKWWRKKYNISFNSSAHRESNFLDQLFEYEEEKLFNELSSKNEEYVPGIGEWLKCKQPETIEESIAQLREEFKDIE